MPKVMYQLPWNTWLKSKVLIRMSRGCIWKTNQSSRLQARTFSKKEITFSEKKKMNFVKNLDVTKSLSSRLHYLHNKNSSKQGEIFSIINMRKKLLGETKIRIILLTSFRLLSFCASTIYKQNKKITEYYHSPW